MKRSVGAAAAVCTLALAFSCAAGAQTLHLKINCGDNVYDVAGWQRDDAYVTGGEDWVNPDAPILTEQDVTGGVANAAPLDVYKSVRHLSPHTYDFPASVIPNGTYLLRFHFIDKYTVHYRSMSYFVEGVQIIDDLDVTKEVGYVPNRALVKDFTIEVTDGDGMQILCIEEEGPDVFEGGIEIIEETPSVLTTIAVTPSTATIGPGAQQAFTAAALDQFGYPFPATITWGVSGGGTMSAGTGAASTFVSDGTEGDFTVTASSGSVTGTATVTVTAALPGGFQLLSPDGASKIDPEDTVVFDWDVSAGATSYDFELAADEAFTDIVIDLPALTDTSATLLGGQLAHGEAYYWRVTARNTSGGTPATNAPLSFVTAAGPQSDRGFLGCRPGPDATRALSAGGVLQGVLAALAAWAGGRRRRSAFSKNENALTGCGRSRSSLLGAISSAG